ncbi:hypothetical protein Esi_0455_0015 [Ectocarpus siliculosus]|uniref:Uncharacterized protein n=1 Tax=Ectocarpus siliculosus TaxID=2880 RepID=D7G1Q2_ECTSI|nr:hypothetical protein Esi_0455_0015 [Ectocarpus siliculosus]|eukprot:CBJ33297.1 hypothetical protein Esi_0455_0015 [Ectocarpus siliculosus]
MHEMARSASSPWNLARQRHLRLARGRRKAGQDSQEALVRGGQGAGRPQYKVVASACTNAALWIDAGLEPAPVGVVFVARRYGSSLS